MFMGFGENIRILRTIHDMTQQQLAAIAGVTDNAVSAWESGLRQPMPKVAQRLAKHFSVS
jgi:repressor LexA